MSTEFTTEKPIYLQILDYCMDCICSNEWTAGNRIPSVKELSVKMTVNPRTIMKTYEELENQGIIFQRRGLGFYAADNARDIVKKLRWKEFEETVLPEFISRLRRTGYPVDLAIDSILSQTKS